MLKLWFIKLNIIVQLNIICAIKYGFWKLLNVLSDSNCPA